MNNKRRDENPPGLFLSTSNTSTYHHRHYQSRAKSSSSSGSGPSPSIPILHHIHRTASEIQLCEDNADADFRDLCMYKRIVSGISQKTKSLRMNSNHWNNHPSPKEKHCCYDNDEDALRNIIRTRYLNTSDLKETTETYPQSTSYIPTFKTEPRDEQHTATSSHMFCTSESPLSMDVELEEDFESYFYNMVGANIVENTNTEDDHPKDDGVFSMDL